jgi:hypothetical protein
MEALKFAFDTLIIGALALPWLAVLVRMFFLPAIDGKEDGHWPLVSALPEHAREAVLSVVILALGYFLGAAVSRISDDFLGDSDLWSLPTEPSIRVDVYYHEYCDIQGLNVLAAMTLPNQPGTQDVSFCPRTDPVSKKRAGRDARWVDQWSDAITQFFRLEEGKLLLQGDEKTSRFRELHDQIVILRGATLNGMVLSTLCFFGFCASFRRASRNWLSFGSAHAAAAAVLLYGAYSLYRHFRNLSGDPDSFRDPPLAEATMVLVGIAGLLARARVDSRWKYARGCGFSFAFTIVAYGAWWWTEVMYNQGVIHAYPTL